MTSMRIGCDLCHITRIEEMLSEGNGALERLFSSEERAYAMAQQRPAQHLAGIFAAKEALAKALREPGLLGMYYKEVTVSHQKHGSPWLCPSDSLAERLLERGIHLTDLSISHDGEYAVATVLVEATHDTAKMSGCDGRPAIGGLAR